MLIAVDVNKRKAAQVFVQLVYLDPRESLWSVHLQRKYPLLHFLK